MCTHICIYLHVSQQELDTRRIVATGKHWDKKQQHEQSIVRNVLVIVSKPKRRSTFQSQTEGGKRKGEKVTLTPILDLLLSPIRKIPPETPGNPPPAVSEQDTTFTPQYQTYQEIYSICSCSKRVQMCGKCAFLCSVWLVEVGQKRSSLNWGAHNRPSL